MQEAVAFDFGPFPVLTTERLILRELTLADAEDVFVFWGDPEVQRFNAVPSRDVEETRQFIREMQGAYGSRRSVMWAVTERGRGEVVGAMSLHDWSRRHQRAEVGYTLARSWWGRGMAYEAVAALCAFGFDQMGLHRIEAAPSPITTVPCACWSGLASSAKGPGASIRWRTTACSITAPCTAS